MSTLYEEFNLGEETPLSKTDEVTARNCDVARSKDGKIYLPVHMDYDDAVLWLQRKKREENEIVSFQELIQAFPPDGAAAFAKALEVKFGWTSMVKTPGFFGANPPSMLNVDVGPYESRKIPWGRFEIPGVEGHVDTGVGMKDGHLVFAINGEVKQKHYHILADLAKLTREIVAEESIYRGKAFKIEYTAEGEGEFGNMNAPKFLDLSEVKPDELIFSAELDRAINDYVFTPILKAEACEKAGVPVKRGVCLYGGYGTGKTNTAYVAAKHCVSVDRTFIYLKDVKYLAEAIEFAKQYSPAVVFAEDVDRAVGGDRSVQVDQILNTIDGLDSKESKVMVILTTNHVDKINQALLRPGRMDLALEIGPPDALAVERLIRLYSRGLLSDDADLRRAGEALSGQIPAVIREACERAKLSSVARGGDLEINEDDLLLAAETLVDHIMLLNEDKQDPSQLEAIGERLAFGFVKGARHAKDDGLLSIDELGSLPNANGEAERLLHKPLEL